MSDDVSETDSERDELTKRAQTKLAAREKQRLISKKMAEPGDIPPCVIQLLNGKHKIPI